MKKIFYIISSTIILFGCGNSDTANVYKDEKSLPEYPKRILIAGDQVFPTQILLIDDCQYISSQILLIDDCEYISYEIGSNAGFLTHKGNCKFCQLRLEKTIKSILHEN
jgi:hypothetical protein